MADFSIADVTSKLDSLVKSIPTKSGAVDAAKAALSKAESEYNIVLEDIRVLHVKYQEFMKNILSKGGTIHQ